MSLLQDVFDSLTSDELHRARSRSNPFETLRSGMFLNRAALKMANMDARFEFMFTSPKYESGVWLKINYDNGSRKTIFPLFFCDTTFKITGTNDTSKPVTLLC